MGSWVVFTIELVLTMSSFIYIFDTWAICTGLHVWWAAASAEHPCSPGATSAFWDSHFPPSVAVGCLKKETHLLMGWLGYGVYCQRAGRSSSGKKISIVLVSTEVADFLVQWRIACTSSVMADPSSFLPIWRASDCELLSSFLILLFCMVWWGMLSIAALVDGCNRDMRETVRICVFKSLCPPLLNGMDFFFFFSRCSQLSSFHRLSRQYSTDALLIIKNAVRYVKCQSGCFPCLFDAGLNLSQGMWYQLALCVIRK